MFERKLHFDDLDSERITLNSLNLFWIGFTIYSVSYPMVHGLNDPIKPFLFAQLFGLLILLFGAIRVIRFKIENSYLRKLFFLYCIWLLFVILRGIEFDREWIIVMVSHSQFGILIYFAPLVILFPWELPHLKKVFLSLAVHGIFFVAYMVYGYAKGLFLLIGVGSILEYFATLGIPLGFLLLTHIYQPNRTSLFGLAVILLMLFEATLRARRGLMFVSVGILGLSYVIYYFSRRGRMVIFFFSLFIAAIAIFGGIKIFEQTRTDIFQLIVSRWDEDSRSEVVDYFMKDMEPVDWIIGKGMSGEYYCPGIEGNQRTSYRAVIETGYLQVILKGGIISLALLLLIAVPAMIKGLFYSRNILSKAAGLWIFLALVSMFPRTVNTFTLNYIIVWISIGICYSPFILNMTDATIKTILLPSKDKTVDPAVKF